MYTSSTFLVSILSQDERQTLILIVAFVVETTRTRGGGGGGEATEPEGERDQQMDLCTKLLKCIKNFPPKKKTIYVGCCEVGTEGCFKNVLQSFLVSF